MAYVDYGEVTISWATKLPPKSSFRRSSIITHDTGKISIVARPHLARRAVLEHRLNFRTERDSLPTVVGASTLIYVAAATAELRTPAAAPPERQFPKELLDDSCGQTPSGARTPRSGPGPPMPVAQWPIPI